ncbi:zinc ribbon domain-containing protein [Planktothrix agardhii]|uniref:zinc ribbon domain-containing protein n=1 Tax=Planktothrix agardhii TaxID=1160 RepID=UPI003F6DAF40
MRKWIEYFAAKFDKSAIPVAPHYTSQKCSNCGVIVKKSLSTRTHVCSCGCELHRQDLRRIPNYTPSVGANGLSPLLDMVVLRKS